MAAGEQETTEDPGAGGLPGGLDAEAFEALLEDLKQTRGFDFTGYKRTSLGRRVLKRMAQVGLTDVRAYHDHLQVHPEEFAKLFDTLLINVTSFLRDPDRWGFLATEVLPKLIEEAGDDQIRVWSAGCASGEEPYTLAMLFAELLGVEQLEQRVKIYATDVDEDALRHARHGVYDEAKLDGLPDELRARYFQPDGAGFAIRPELRRAVIFGRHDLVSDAPISNLHLLTCRNVLIYLNSETQAQVLRSLHFGLRDDGYLFLGKAEMLFAEHDLFEPVEIVQRVFRKLPNSNSGRRRLLGQVEAPARVARQVRMRDSAFASAPASQIVIDVGGTIELVNEAARSAFGLGSHDIGRPLNDLEVSYRPIDLRAPLDEVRRERRSKRLRTVQRAQRDLPTQFFDVWLVPLFDPDQELIGISITFEDVTGAQELNTRLQQSNQELETAYEELQSTNEELETTNEELQSTVEELETTNEELQSTVEELETTNEELQSATTEQEAINRELMIRTEEVEQVNTYFRSILASLQVGVAVVGTDFEVEIWNEQAFELWGLREDEVVGRSLLALDIGLSVGDLADPIRECLTTGTTTDQIAAATDRRGRAVVCRVRLAPLTDRTRARAGVVVLMDVLPSLVDDADADHGDDA